jgi:hypothetical protein
VRRADIVLRERAAQPDSDDGSLRVRVSLMNGTDHIGELSFVNDEEIGIAPQDGAQPLACDWRNVSLVEISHPLPQREWLLFGGEILAVGAAVFAITAIPGLYFNPLGYKLLAVGIFGAVGLLHLRFRNRIKDWMADWEPLLPP